MHSLSFTYIHESTRSSRSLSSFHPRDKLPSGVNIDFDFDPFHDVISNKERSTILNSQNII
jgi:hypothetical protein